MRPLARLSAAVSTVLSLAGATPARADVELTSDAGSADLLEREHQRQVQLRPLWLEVSDRHRFANRGNATRQLIYRFDLPARAAITAVSVTAGGKTHRAVAIDAAAAIRALPETTADVERADFALLREIEPDAGAGAEGRARFELTVYPLDPGTSVAVSIDWTAPTRFADHRVSASLPARGALHSANLAATRIDLRASGWGAVRDLADLTLDGDKRARLDVAAGGRTDIDVGARARFGRAGTLDLGLAAIELDSGLRALAITGVAGPGSRNLGRYLHVIIAVDVSASMGRSGIAAAASIADSILAELPPETRVAVIPFDREARPLPGGFSANDHLVRARVARALAVNKPRNGSDLGAALAGASALLDGREVRRLTRDARVSGEPSAAIIAISDQATPLGLDAASARGRLSKFALDESAFFAITVAPSGRDFPVPLAGALDDLVARSGGAAFAVRASEAVAQGPAIAKQLGTSSQLSSLQAKLGAEQLEELALPDRVAPGSGFLSLVPWAGPVPKSLSIVAHRRAGPLAMTVRPKRDRALEAVVAPMMLRGLEPSELAAAHRRAERRGGPSAPLSGERDAERQIARAGMRHGTVGRTLSLVIPHPTDRFAKEQLAFAARWGSWLYRRAPTPAEASGDIEHRPWRGSSASPPIGRQRASIPRGNLDASTLKREIRHQLFRRIRGCYDRELRAAPRLQGSLTVRFEIADGETRAVDIAAGSIGRSALKRCVVEAGYRLVPPRAAGDDTIYVVRYPLSFRVSNQRGEVSEDDGSGKAIELDPDDPLGGID